MNTEIEQRGARMALAELGERVRVGQRQVVGRERRVGGARSGQVGLRGGEHRRGQGRGIASPGGRKARFPGSRMVPVGGPAADAVAGSCGVSAAGELR